jgi:protein-disulfide isomerase
MLEHPQVQQEPQAPPESVASAASTASPASSTRKWIMIAIGGGCALIACVGLVAALVVTALVPWITTTRTFTSGPQQVITVQPDAADPSPAPSVGQGPGNTLGDPNAPVKLIEYADFQCPYCMRYSQETEPKIVEQYVKTGKVFYEYRSVGGFIGPESAAAAEAAYCAGDQGKFWEYHDALFSHWTGENVGDFASDKLLQYAQSVGLDQAAFSECLSSSKYAARVQQDASNARADGVQATPSFLVNGKLIEGAEPFSVFQKAIDAALQGQ